MTGVPGILPSRPQGGHYSRSRPAACPRRPHRPRKPGKHRFPASGIRPKRILDIAPRSWQPVVARNVIQSSAFSRRCWTMGAQAWFAPGFSEDVRNGLRVQHRRPRLWSFAGISYGLSRGRLSHMVSAERNTPPAIRCVGLLNARGAAGSILDFAAVVHIMARSNNTGRKGEV